MDSDPSAKRRRLSMDHHDELYRLLTAAFPDDPDRLESLYSDALDHPRLAEELLRAERWGAARGDLKGAVERAHRRWQAEEARQAEKARQAEEAARQREAEGIINQRADIAVDLRRHALELIRTNPAFVDSVLRLPTDERYSLQVLANDVDGEAALRPAVAGVRLMWDGRSARHHLPEGHAG